MSDTLGPVEVEFSIPDDFEKDIDSAIKKMAGLTGAASKLPADVKAALVEQSSIVKSIEADIKTLEKSLNSVAPGRAKQELIQEVAAAKRALAEEQAALKGLETQNEQTKGSTQRLSFQLRDMVDQLTKMRLAGKQGTEEYRRMELAAAALSDEIADVRSNVRNLADDQQNFKGFADGVTGLTGAFAAAGGAVALFAGENENLQKIQTKVQGLMAITIGLQQVSNTLNKDSAFMTVTVVKAKQLWAAAEMKLTAALWGSNVAAKALMATLTLGIAVAIPVIISLFDRWNTAQKEAIEAQREAVKVTKNANIEAGKSRVEIEMLISKLRDFKGSKLDEKRMVDEVNKKYGDTFGTYKTLASWLDVLKSKSDAYVQSMFLQAKTQGIIAKANLADIKVQNYSAEPLSTFERSNDGYQTVNTPAGNVRTFDPQLAKQQAEERKRQFIRAAQAERDQLLRDAKEVQAELLNLTADSGLNPPDPEKTKDEKTEKTYAQKLAEVKKFYELYNKAIELGQAEAAELFRAKLPDASTFQGYVNSEIIKASKQGNQEKLSALLPEQEQFRTGLNDLLGEFKTYQEQRAAIEKEYNEKIGIYTIAGYTEKAKIATEARDLELKALDDSQPLNKLIEKYRDYRGQIMKIAQDSQAEIDQLRASGNEDEAIEAERQRDEAIQKLILENELEAYNRMAEMGKKELQAFMEKIKAKIALMKAEGKSVELLEKAYAEAQTTLDGSDVKKFRQIANIFGSITQAAGLLNEELGRMVNLAANIASNLGGALEAMKKGGLEGAAGFGSMISIVATIADELDKAFGLQKRMKDIEQERAEYNSRLQVIIENTNADLERQLKLLDAINGTDKGEAFNDSIDFLKASIESTKAALEGFKFDFAPAPKSIDQDLSLEQLKLITNAKDDAEAIRMALAGGLITQDQADLANQYINTLEDMSDKLQELTAQEIEWYTQTSGTELSNQLADSIVNAFNEGTDAALAWGDATDQVLSNAIINALKMKLLSEPMNAAVAQLAADMEEGGGLSDQEQAEFRAKLEAAGKNFNDALAAYPDLFGPDEAAAAMAPDKNMFSGMNQQTGSELLGQFTALRMSSARVADILADERNARAAMRQTLEIIAENTWYCRKLDNIDRTLTTLETDGIKVR